MEEWYHYLLLVVVGFTVGFVNTMAGGGSLLSLPVLIFLGLPPSVANGTNRVAIVIQTALGTAGFKSKGVSTYPFNIYLAITAFIGSIIGANIAVDIKGETFNKILAIIMVAVVLIILFKPKMKTEGLEERLKGKYFGFCHDWIFLFWYLRWFYQCWIRLFNDDFLTRSEPIELGENKYDQGFRGMSLYHSCIGCICL